MKLPIFIFGMIVCALGTAIIGYTLYLKIRCYISDYRYEVQITAWRKKLSPGAKIKVQLHTTQNKTVVAVNGDIVQVQSEDGNLSGHHISTIYPITRD